MNGYDKLIKLILLGDCAVGKTTVTHRLMNKAFTPYYSPTVGIDYGTTRLQINNEHVKIQLWDTAGQEKFCSLIKSYYKGIAGAILIYDVNKRSTFDKLQFWLEELNNNRLVDNYPISILLLANKTDVGNRVISYQEGLAFANLNGFIYKEGNVKLDDNIIESFQSLCKEIMKNEHINKGIIDINKRRKENEIKKQKAKIRETYYCPLNCNIL